MADDQEHPLITWALEQPGWQQHALRLIAKYGSAEAIPEEDIKQIKNILLKEAKEEEPFYHPLTSSDIQGSSSQESKTYFKSLGPVANIDKLASGQGPFEFVGPNGMTVIFGNNGSGKSGYARILKHLYRSHGEVKELRGDATSETKSDWEVNLTYAEKEQGADEIEKSLTWVKADKKKAKNDPEYKPLERIAFFDSDVANTYVDGERTLFYLPAEIRLYAELAILAGDFKESINKNTTELKSQLPRLPETTEGTSAHTTLTKLKSGKASELTKDDIDAICALTDDEKSELEELKAKKRQTPEQQKLVIGNAKATLVKLNEDVGKTAQAISPEAIQQLFNSHEAYQDTKSKAEQGVAGLAENMPISEGIGSDIWFEMFRAARTFAGSIYPDTTPPPIANGEHCVLCHQDLNNDASERLKQFDAFMDDALQQEAEKAKEAFISASNTITSLQDLHGETITNQLQAYSDLSDTKKRNSGNIVTDVQAVSSRLSKIKTLIQENCFDDLQTMVDETLSLRTNFDSLISECNSELESLEHLITEGATGLSKNDQSRLSALEDMAKCLSQKPDIKKYYELSKRIASLKACTGQLNTNRITSQSRNRGDILYSDDLKSRYQNEIGKLGLKYLNVSVGTKVARGQQRVEPSIQGLQKDKKSEILSEGEQRAMALAGFLTEVNEVDAGHAIIFDDPVSSLDWDRRGLVAERLAEEANKRQIVVFTHDFSFALQLEKSVIDKNRGNSEPFWKQLWIAKQSIGTDLQFGVTGDTVAAWESKKVSQRLLEIQTKIDELEKSGLVADGSGNSDFEGQASDIARRLRQTWERAVEEVALNETIRRLQPNVMTTKLEQVQFDCATDYQALHQGMSAISTPAHDNPEHGGNAAPTLEQLKQSKALLESWTDGLKKRRRALAKGGDNA